MREIHLLPLETQTGAKGFPFTNTVTMNSKGIRIRRSRKRYRRKRAYLIFSLCGCLLFLIFLYRREATLNRALPRFLREVKRSSVNWGARLVVARSRPKYNTSSEELNVFVITLQRTPARRAQLIHNLTQAGVAHKIFFAVDGLLPLNGDDILKYAGLRKRSRLTSLDVLRAHSPSPELDLMIHERLRFGCYISHVRLWEHLVNSELPFAVILEDDVIILERFDYSLRHLIRNLPDNWDIFYLNSCFSKLGGLLRPGIFQLRGALCTYGYVISKDGANKLLQSTALSSEKPVDHMLDEAIFSRSLTAYQALPPLILPRLYTSTLAYPHGRSI